MRELEADLSNGIVSKEQYAQDREELERRLLEDVSSGNGSKARNSRPPIAARNLAFGLAIAIPVIATLFYLRIGNQNARSETVATTGAQASSPSAPFANQSGEMTPQQIEANVAALAKRLEQNPNDSQGWTMLARSYSQMQRYKDAAEAYGHATALDNNNADLWADYAYVVAMINGKEMQGKPTEFINKALAIDPQNRSAL